MIVTWTLPETTSANEIESISVSFSEESRAEDVTVSDFESNTATFTADGLSPGTRYNVAVVTKNQQGASDPAIITVVTLEEPTTLSPTTQAPSTKAPTTQPPSTQAPSTQAPTQPPAGKVKQIIGREVILP